MAYINFDNLYSMNRGGAINEDLKTVAHNTLISNMGGYHALGHKGLFMTAAGILTMNPITIAASVGGFKDFIDKKYFTSHWTLSDKIKSNIAAWCKQAGATPFKPRHYANDTSDDSGISTKIRQDDHETGHLHTRLATRSWGKGALTTSTTCLPISAGKNLYYYVYPTFDATDIYDLKALKQDQKNGKEYSVVELRQWKNIDHSQFKK